MGKVFLAAHVSLTIPFAIKQARADEPLPESVSNELDVLLYERSHASSKHTRIAAKIDMSDFPSSGGEHTDRFLREALFLARLHHPAIPRNTLHKSWSHTTCSFNNHQHGKPRLHT